ncbi:MULTISPECIES: hypothetical protein [unclassified Variovorax]|uniref:hypothetical protein n=1 Tax=unclassified Variovorax TaxID=663243 RepID=UPI0034E8878A
MESDPMLDGAEAATGGTVDDPIGAMGVTVAWAMTTGATSLLTAPEVDGIDVCDAVM